jgi:peptide deformylase
MVLPIILYGSTVLRKRAFDIDKEDNLKEIVSNMVGTLKQAKGIGLAGPQVDLLKNIFIIDTTPLEGNNMEMVEKVCLNPEIIHYADTKAYYEEGCLSIPGIFEEVKRPEQVEVRYRDENFEWQEEVLTGITARIFQHEYDHLQGVLFIDRINALRRKMIRSKLKKISHHKSLI